MREPLFGDNAYLGGIRHTGNPYSTTILMAISYGPISMSLSGGFALIGFTFTVSASCRYFPLNIMLFSIFFTPIFLTINHLHSTCASPILSKDDVAAAQLLNLTHSIVKRDYLPPDQLCEDSYGWVRRNCLTVLDDRVWFDYCLDDDEEPYIKLGSCPVNTICMNTFGPPPDLDPTIFCIARPSSLYNHGAELQIGVEAVNSEYTPGPVERMVSVDIRQPIRAASVACLIEGTDGNYLVEPIAAFVGSLRGTTAKTCQYNETNRDCVPAGAWNLADGDIIDFTFGLNPAQSVRFYYAIIGSARLEQGRY